MRALDLVGQRFGRLTVVRRVENDSRGQVRWLCRCDCGNEVSVPSDRLAGRETKSCGCLRREMAAEGDRGRAKHMHCKTGTYHSWQRMKTRCTNLLCDKYPIYGGRGVTVCERWLHSFENFLADMGERPAGKTIDRIDPDGHYEPGNCRWATPLEQRHNRRRCA